MGHNITGVDVAFQAESAQGARQLMLEVSCCDTLGADRKHEKGRLTMRCAFWYALR
jgi:hypothetical protein